MPARSSRQLILLPPPHVWEMRFGPALFRRIPAQPGVYLLGDAQGRLIYVGKAVNLRRRLQSYRHLPLERCSRKTARLLQETHAISWEVLPHAAAALLRENELLRLFKPKFNQLNTRPEHYGRVSLALAANGALLLRWGRGQPPPGDAGPWHGAFKGIARLREALRGLLRLCLCLTACPPTLHELPPVAYREKLPPEILLPHPLPPPLREISLWHDFFGGREARLLEQLAAALPLDLNPSWQRVVRRDMERLRAFYTTGPQRNRLLCERAGLPGSWLAPEELDDLLALELARRQTAR